VFELGSQLLSTLEKCRLPREDETTKGIGWFLVCIGESLAKGSLIQARKIRAEANAAGQMPKSSSLSIAFCLMGDQVMDWGTGQLHQERKKNANL
jgi:hypothetical protein